VTTPEIFDIATKLKAISRRMIARSEEAKGNGNHARASTRKNVVRACRILQMNVLV
jgi:hypothetical protein